jgi:uncharacterized protein YhaN
MTTEERFQRTEENLDRLTNVVGTLTASVAAHDSQIEALITISENQAKAAEKQAAETQALKERFDSLIREWQAYLRTIHPHQ